MDQAESENHTRARLIYMKINPHIHICLILCFWTFFKAKGSGSGKFEKKPLASRAIWRVMTMPVAKLHPLDSMYLSSIFIVIIITIVIIWHGFC